MKRKRNQGCVKKTQGSCEAAQSSLPQFLQGLQCHVHPACFGSMRLKIFENHIKQYGGQLVPTLPEVSEATLHVVFEESVDEEKVKRLVDISQLPNSIFLRCSWLVECVKSKGKARIEDHLIMSVNPTETWTLEEGVKEAGWIQNKNTDKTCTEVPNRTQTGDIDKTQMEETHRTLWKKTEFQSQGTVGSSDANVEHEAQDTALTPDLSVRVTTQLTSNDQTRNATESQSFALYSREDGITEYQKEPLSKIVGEAQVNKLVTCTEDSGSADRDISRSLIRPFPKNLQEKFACARPSSSKSVNLNAHITLELEKLANTYKSTNDTWRAVGYQRAIAAIRNYDKEITSREEALAIPGIGGRLADKIAEILESGRLRKVAEVCEGEEAKTLSLFLGVWGAGPTTAQMWYHQGHRTLEDLRTKATLTRHQQIGLKLYDDINSRIPRSEVVEIENYVREATLCIAKDAEVMVCGSYRRGKPTCGDVDVLITHPDGYSHELIFKPLLARLRETEFLTDDLVTQEDNGNQKKYLGVCRLPGEGRKHRRLDVIVVPFEERATALMYFTGSAHFNRSMRLLATKKGMSLSEHSLRAGIVRQGGEKLNEGYVLETPTEESVFAHLGLVYRPPEERDH